jgi:hypothetical protein
VRPVRGADNLTAIYEPMSRICVILNISQPYRPPRHDTGIALLYFFYKGATCGLVPNGYRRLLKTGLSDATLNSLDAEVKIRSLPLPRI